MTVPAPSNTEFIKKLREITLTNISDENFGVNELAKATGLNYFSLNRKLHSAIKKTVSQFINETRLEKAKEILEQEDHLTASEVAYRVGFGSPAYFSRCFHEHFGYPPGEIKKRGTNEQVAVNNDPSFNLKTEVEISKNLPEQPPYGKKPGLKGVVFVSAGILILAILASFYFFRIFNQSLPGLNPEDKSIAVIPFKSLSSDEENQSFAEGVTSDILFNLIQISEIKVINRPVEELEGNTLNLTKLAGRLNVRFFLSGSVQKSGEQILVMAQLTDITKNQIIWSEKYPRKLSDIFQIQSDIAKQVATNLQSVITRKENEQIEKVPTQNKEAYNLYLKGRFFWNRRTEEGVKKSIEYFEKAVEADPDYALAWAGLADGYQILAGYGWYKPRKEGHDKAKNYVLKALEIDNNLAEAHTTLALILGYRECKWEEAIKEVTLAIKLNPNYSFAHQIYAQLLDVTGDYKKAREEIDLALKLDPLTLIMHTISATLYYNEKNFNASLLELREAQSIEKNSQWPYFISFKIYYRQGKGEDALNEIKNFLLLDTLTSKYVCGLDSLYSKSGLYGLMDWVINIAPTLPKVRLARDISGFYAISGQKDTALICIEKYLEDSQGDPLVRLINHLDYESLRSEPRFKAVVDKLGLTEYYLKRVKDPGYIKNQ